MGNGPQQPGNWLPGFEYEVQAPGRTTALSGRFAVHVNSPNVVVPPNVSTSVDCEVVLVPDLTWNDGVYLVRASLLYGPVDPSGSLQITGGRIFLTNGTDQFDIGIPIATTLAPQTTIMIIQDRDLALKMSDLQRFGWRTTNPFNIHGNAFVKNLDGANPHSVNLNLYAIAYALRGFYS